MTKRIVSALNVALGAFFLFAAPASAQPWPTAKPITIVVPFPPGPALDLVARLVGAKLSESLGQTVLVDNRSGANGTIGSNMVARAAPDGYTLLAGTVGTHVTAVHLMKSLPYDPVKDFTPLMASIEPATCLAVSSSLPVNSVPELIDYAKANPGKLSYGTSGVGSVFHMMGELFNQTAGVNIAHVPYRGVAASMQDVIGGHIPMVFIAVSNAMAGVKQGSVKILAVLEEKRYARLPQVPSMSEFLPSFKKPSSWFGFFGPPKLPPEIVARLSAEMRKAINAPDVKAKLEAADFAVIGDTPEEFAALLKDGIERYGAIIKAAGIPPQ